MTPKPMIPKPMIVAIDGPAGAGKSTLASKLAYRLGVPHVDTGALYRLVGLEVLLRAGDPHDSSDAHFAATHVTRGVTMGPDGTFSFNGRIVGAEIRTAHVSSNASIVASHPGVRSLMVGFQRTLCAPWGAVVEGRDIGSVVWPDATLKVWLEADTSVRTLRRNELVSSRDERDAQRTVGPMQPMPTSLRINSTELGPDEVLARVLTELSSIKAPMLFRGVRWLSGSAIRLGLGLRTEGVEHVPLRGPAIIAANHRSNLDVSALLTLTKRKIWFMANKDLYRGPVGNLLDALGAFPVDRTRLDRSALRRAMEILSNGELLGLFPEGTRVRISQGYGELLDGVAWLALRSQCPIVPVGIANTSGRWFSLKASDGTKLRPVLSGGHRSQRRVVVVAEPQIRLGPSGKMLRSSETKMATATLKESLLKALRAAESR